MLNFIKPSLHFFHARIWKPFALSTKILMSIILLSPFIFMSKSLGQTIDFQQPQNGDPTAFPVTFTNGILNATQTTYYEGLGIPQRLIFTGLDPAAAKYTVYFNFLAGIPNKQVHAYDFLMSWEQAVQTAINIGGAISGQGTENELQNLFSAACQNAPVECAALSGALPAANIKRPVVPDMPGTGFYSGVQANINCFEGVYGNRDIEIRGDQAISSAVLTFVGYTGDYANFKLEWVSTSTKILIRYASRAAVGDGGASNFACGYGVGHGAGAISGGNYHNIFEKLVKNNNTGNEIQGSRDNQLSAGAITPVTPPACPSLPTKSVCASATSIAYSIPTPEAGVTYKWSLTNGSTSAGAKLQGADANGFVTATSVTVIPIGATFIAGGTFSLTVVLSKSGVPDVTCTYSNIGSITKLIATASANPTSIDVTSAAHSTTLTADIDATSSDPNNANYNYQWIIVTAGTAGTLTNATSRIATYTAGAGDAGSTIQFKVTATHKDDANVNTQECAADATTSVTLNSASGCSVSSQAPVCSGTTTTHNGTPNPKPGTATYTWTLEAYGGGGSTTSTFTTANGGTSISVNAIESYRIVLSQVYQNTTFNTSCSQDVTVDAAPSVTTQYNAPACDKKTFSVDVTNSKGGYTYSISQPDNPTNADPGLNDITPVADGDPVQFTGLTAGDGFVVTVTTPNAGCTATSSCGSNTPVCPANNLVSANKSSNVATTETVAKSVDTYKIVLESSTKVKAVPNPYTDKIRFNLVSGVSGIGSLELYNSLGQKIAVVFQGYVQAGTELNKEYNVPREQRSTLIYVFKVGEQKVTGKMIGLQ